MIMDKEKELELAKMVGTTEVRLSWRIPGYGEGHGDWFPESKHGMLLSHTLPLNKEYGIGTHWIERRNEVDA